MNIALVKDSPQIKPRDPFEIKSDLLWSIDIQNKSTEDINEKRLWFKEFTLFCCLFRSSVISQTQHLICFEVLIA